MIAAWQLLEAKLEGMKLVAGECRCHEGFTSRRLKDPQCEYHSWDNEMIELRKEIEELKRRGKA